MRNAAVDGGYGDALPRAVAINYAKLLAYKDEYEVARLFTDGRFEKQLRDQFDGDFKFSFNLAPPMLGGGKDALGRPKKRAFGAWMMPVFRMLAKLRACAAPPFDIFGYSADRKLERDLIAGYEKDVATVLGLLSPLTLDTAVEMLSLPDRIRGYGPVKEKVGARRQGALRATGRRSRQPAAGAAADRGGVSLSPFPGSRLCERSTRAGPFARSLARPVCGCGMQIRSLPVHGNISALAKAAARRPEKSLGRNASGELY